MDDLDGPPHEGFDMPHSDMAERVALGCMILHPSAALWGSVNLHAKHFHRPMHQHVFRAVAGLVRKGYSVDLVSVCEVLRSGKKLEWCGGDDGVIALAESTVSGPSAYTEIKTYGAQIRELYQRREYIKRASELLKLSLDGATSIDKVNAAAFALPHGIQGQGSDTYLTSAYDPDTDAGLKGVPTGIPSVDRYVGTYGVGYPKGNLSMVGARRGMGKSAFMVGSMVHALRKGNRCAYATLEMRAKSITDRMVKTMCGWDTRPRVDSEAGPWRQAVEQVRAWDVPMWDPSGRNGIEKTVETLTAWAIDLKEARGLDALFVDYFQLFRVKGRFDNRTRELDYVADQLMWLGQNLECAVVVGSQLSKLQDGTLRAKDCIKIEDNAELVLYLSKEKGGKYDRTVGATVTIGKNRHGRETSVDIEWSTRCVRFQDPNASEPEEEPYDPFADTEDVPQEVLQL